MNCQDFESLAGDLARGVPVDVRAREEARTHEATCPRCAARLASERALSAGLRGLAASAAAAAAPPHVEANLLAHFRAQAAGARTETEAAAPHTATPAAEKVLPFARAAAPRRWSWVKAAAAAASAAAAAVTLFVLVAPQNSQTPPSAATSTAGPARAALIEPPTRTTGEAFTTADNARPGDAPIHVTPGVRPIDPSRAVRAPGRLAATPASFRSGGSRAARLARGAQSAAAEIATSFIPLTQDAALAAAEGGQVVRVELPRTALQRFGLPMNVEFAGGRVKADLLLGHDGVARAIRFVR